MSRNIMQMEKLLRELNLPGIEAIDEYGNTALHLIVKNKIFTEKKIVEVLEMLLNKGINPNTKNKNNQTVLHLAVAYRMKDVVNFLISRKINMDSVPHFFIEDEYLTIQDFLAQMNKLDEWHGEMSRVKIESADFVEWLIFKGFDFDGKNQENRSALSMAIKLNLQHILPVLVKYTKDVNFIDIEATDNYGNTALHLTVKNKSFTQKKIVEDIKVLIGRGINPNSKNNKNQTALHLAVLYRMKDVINCLMVHNVNLDLVAHFFVEDEYATYQELLIQMDNLDEWYGEILRTETESIDFVEWLISKGIDFDYKNQENVSALNMAIDHNLQHILPVLLNYTKDINLVDKDNKTLLHLFLQKNCTSTCYSAKSINKKWYAERYAADIVKILLDRGLPADAEDRYKLTPIQIAIVKEADIGVIQILMKESSKIYDRHIHGETMFQVVIRYCLSASKSRSEYYLTILSSLIAKGADVNKLYEFDIYGYTAICYAVAYRNMWLINFLGENGADFSVTTKDGRNLLHLLATSAATAENGDDPEVEVNTTPHEFVFFWDEAIEHTQHIQVVRKLIEHGVEVGLKKTRPYHRNTSALYVAAVRKGDLGLMISLEKNGINFRVTTEHEVVVPTLDNHETKSVHVLELSEENEEDFRLIVKSHESLLHRFSKSNYEESDNDTNIKLVDLFISEGCQVNGKDIIGNTPLHEAVSHDNEALVRKLIEHGAHVNCRRNDGMTPLHVAAFGRANVRLLKLLIQNGADVNAATANGETLMHLMLKYSEDLKYNIKSMETFHWLMSEGCRVNVKDNAGNSPLHVAAEHASDQFVQMLIENGANVNSRNNRRETPLYCAVKNCHRRAQVSKLLLNHDANVNAKDSKGRTALHKIAMEFQSGYLEMLRTLLEYGADVTALNANGLSALSCAHFREHEIKIDDVYQHYLHKLFLMDDIIRNEFFVLEFSEDGGWHFVKMYGGELYISEDDCGEETVCTDYPRDDSNYNVKLSFVRHSLKLTAANLPWDPILGNDIESDVSGLLDLGISIKNTYCCLNYHDDCWSEMEALKIIFIDDHTSLYTLLHMNPNRRCAYARNKKLRELVHEKRCRQKKYFVLVSACYREAVKRKSLLELAKETWLELTKIYLPVEILEFIFSYLSNDDLFNIVDED